jgi:hypothetical protein
MRSSGIHKKIRVSLSGIHHKNQGDCGSIAEMKGETNTKSDIGPFKFKTSNLQTKHKHLRRIVHPSLISNCAQSNTKSHLSHLNIINLITS